jgi:3-phosphoshikimate 1-carboxyvinyltransferase
MELVVRKSKLGGRVLIPASKSHTIRAVLIATLADGRSVIRNPLVSGDTAAVVNAARAFGAEVEEGEGVWRVKGLGGAVGTPEGVIDVLNSGTTLYLAMGVAALGTGTTMFTGDESIRSRPAQVLIDALNDLGAEVFSTQGNGCAPIVVRGPMKGGKTTVQAVTSQYVSSLLMSCPLAQADTELTVTALNERPYVRMTMDWLDLQGISYRASNDLSHFVIPGAQSYHAYERSVPGDFSSATFFLVAAAVTGSELLLEGLDVNDSQGDKAVIDMLRTMGARIEATEEGIVVSGGELRGAELDLNATPDALPALAVAGCMAQGETLLVNVAQARVKETDRIAVMCAQLRKMGADIEELPDGLVVRRSHLKGAKVAGHADHRVVMALTVAGLTASGHTTIDTAEAAAVTFPGFAELMRTAGGDVKEI